MDFLQMREALRKQFGILALWIRWPRATLMLCQPYDTI